MSTWPKIPGVRQKLISLLVALTSTKVGRRVQVALGGVGEFVTLMGDVSQMDGFACQWAREYLTWASKKTCDVRLVLYMRSRSG